MFLFREVLGVENPGLGDFVRAKGGRRVPEVLSKDEVRLLLGEMEGTWGLMAELLYGTGMRLMECVRLRVKDVDFPNGMVIVRQGKGRKDRRTPLPRKMEGRISEHLEQSRKLYDADREKDLAGVWMPEALDLCLLYTSPSPRD